MEFDRASGGGIFARVVRIYLGEAAVILKDLNRAVQVGDTERAGGVAHALKSARLNVGAVRLAALCRKLEAQSRNGTAGSGPVIAADCDLVSGNLLRRLSAVVTRPGWSAHDPRRSRLPLLVAFQPRTR